MWAEQPLTHSQLEFLAPPVSADKLTAALGVLGFSHPVSWEDVRSAYREQLRQAHPDVPGGSDSGRTEEIVTAFRFLREATKDGLVEPVTVLGRYLAAEAAELAPEGELGEALPVVRVQSQPNPGATVVRRVAEAMAHLGQVSGLDHSAGLIQAVVTEPGYAPSQLTAEVIESGGNVDPRVLFTLEPLGGGDAPPLVDLVRRLAEHAPDLSIIAE